MPEIIRARYTLVDGQALADHALCVNDGRIIAAGTLAELAAQYPDAKISGGDSYMLCPGLINAHDHGRALGTLAMGVNDDFLELWLPRLAALPAIPPYLAALYSGVDLLLSGVTGLAHSHNPASWARLADEIPAAIRGYQEAGIRVAMHPPIVDQNQLVYAERERFLSSLPPGLRAQLPASDGIELSADDYFAMLDELFATYHDSAEDRLHIQASPAGGQWCSDALIIRACQWARRRDTRAQMHLLETAYQRHYAYKTWGMSFVRHLDAIGALGDWLTLAHMVWVERDDYALLAERGVGIVHNISSNLRLRSGLAPIAEMNAAGIKLGIGLDGHALDDDQDFLREMRLAWTLANRSGMRSASISASQIWRLGASGGADISFGPGARLGRLEPGARADLVLLDWDAIKGAHAPDSFLPLEALPAFALRRATRRHTRHVMVAGEWLARDGRHKRVDIDALRREIYARLEVAAGGASELASYLRGFYRGWDD